MFPTLRDDLQMQLVTPEQLARGGQPAAGPLPAELRPELLAPAGDWDSIRAAIEKLCARFPVYPGF